MKNHIYRTMPTSQTWSYMQSHIDKSMPLSQTGSYTNQI
ncbi:hypothetical protein F383_22956 [Gossypium arboreum]|uniref:Uncharacterized protein n=1 Tax=Gossypium arboreum TaxID=29729 RepID=A0A0B0NQ53_GOSAR|nr:hypothetical protein F383_22956 [Gossypium arboreum]